MGLRLRKLNGLKFGSVSLGGLTVAALALGIAGCKGGGSSDTIATINGVAITQKQYLDYIMRKATVSVAANGAVQQVQTAPMLGIQALDDMVGRQLMLNLAKEMGVMPTDADVSKEIEFLGKRTPNFLASLTAQGYSMEYIKRDVTIDLAKMNIITHGITVTPSDIDAFIRDNPTQFRNPATVNALYVVVASEDAKKQVDADLASGQDFQSVAMHYSKAPNIHQLGVRVPSNNLEGFKPVYRQALEATTEGKTTQWVTDAPGQFVKFYVQGKTAPSPVKIDDVVREVVRRKIAVDRGMKATDLNQRILAELKKSTIDVQFDALKPGWKTYMDAVNNQKAQAGTPSSTSTAPTAPTGATGGTPPASTPAPGSAPK